VCLGEPYQESRILAAVLAQKPDLVLLDIPTGQEDRIQFIKTLRAHIPRVHLLVISPHQEALHPERALRAGAHGYVMREESSTAVLAAIRTVLGGEFYITRKMAAALLQRLFAPRFDPPSFGIDTLTPREHEVFQLLGTGLNAAQIADQLLLSINTVETHRQRIKQKLGLTGVAELVRHATQSVRAPQ